MHALRPGQPQVFTPTESSLIPEWLPWRPLPQRDCGGGSHFRLVVRQSGLRHFGSFGIAWQESQGADGLSPLRNAPLIQTSAQRVPRLLLWCFAKNCSCACHNHRERRASCCPNNSSWVRPGQNLKRSHSTLRTGVVVFGLFRMVLMVITNLVVRTNVVRTDLEPHLHSCRRVRPAF